MVWRRSSFHSSSVCGNRSCSPSASTIVATEFHTKSALGSTIESIMSLTVAVGRYEVSLGDFDAQAASSSSRKPEHINGFIQ